jgi:hypothetical protein
MTTKKEKRKHDDYEWVRKIIESCSNEGQFEIALNVIDQFDKMYSDSTYFDSLRKILSNEISRLNEKVHIRFRQKLIQKYGEQKLLELSKKGNPLGEKISVIVK